MEKVVRPGCASPAVALLSFVLRSIVALTLFSLMAITFLDVIGRYLFSLPIPGAFEITQVLMAVLIFSGLPLVCADDSNIKVDVFFGLMHVLVRRVLNVLNHFVSAVALAFLAWRLWVKGDAAAAAGEQSMYLAIPMYPFAYLMSVLTALAALFVVAHLVGRAASLGESTARSPE